MTGVEMSHRCTYKSTTEDSAMPCADRSALYDDTKDKDSRVDQDTVLAGDNLSQETGIESSNPGTEFENGCEPTSLAIVLGPGTHG
jgi:hypothetical protein